MPLTKFAEDSSKGANHSPAGNAPNPDPDAPNYQLIFKYTAPKSEFSPDDPENYEEERSRYPFTKLGKTPTVERERAARKAREREEEGDDQYDGGSPTLIDRGTDRRMNPEGYRHLPVPSPGSYSNVFDFAAPPVDGDVSEDDDGEDDEFRVYFDEEDEEV